MGNMFCWKSSVSMTSQAKVVLLACGSYNPVTNMHLRMFEIARDALHRTGRYQVVSGIMSPVGDGYSKKELVASKHRCEMLKAALKSSDWIKMDTWECTQSTWSTTAKVLRHQKQQLDVPNNSTHRPSPSKRRRRQHNSVSDIQENQVPLIDIEGDHVPSIKLLCGADLLESFAVPGLWEEEDIEYIVGTHGLVVITRYGSDPLKFIYESDILTKFQAELTSYLQVRKENLAVFGDLTPPAVLENIFIVTEWIYNDISSTKVRRALRRGESVKYVLQDSVIDYIREHHLYGVPDNKYINHMMPSPNQEANTESEEKDSNSSAGEVSVVLRSSNQDGYSSLHMPLHRMSTNLDKRSPAKSIVSSRVPCFTDIGMLVKRVKNVRVGFTPETCV